MTLSRLATKFDAAHVKDDGSFQGYASVFGNVDSYKDIVAPGAFKSTLDARGATRVKMLWQHDPSQPIGVWKSMAEDSKGLIAEGALALGTAKGRETYELMKMGAVDGLSIGFITKKDEFDRTSGIRTIKSVDLLEVSIVTFPANDQATVTGVKAGEDMTEREFEALLRDAGLSREFAKRVTLHGFKGAVAMSARDQRDAGRGEDMASLMAAINRAAEALRT